MRVCAPLVRRAACGVAMGVAVCAGCTGVEPAAVGMGLSAVEAGSTVLGRGKVAVFEHATMAEAEGAVRRAADFVALRFLREREEPFARVLVYVDDRDAHVVVSIIRRTSALTLIRADVGLLGQTGLAAVLMKQVQIELEKGRMGEAATP